VTTLGEAFIEVHADTKPFAREIAPQLKAILDAVGKEGNKKAKVAGQKITEGLDEGIGAKFPLLRRRFSVLGRWIDELRDRIDKRGGLRQSFERLAKGNFILTRLFGAFALKVGGVFKSIGNLTKGFLGLLTGIDLVFQGVVGLVSEGFKAFIGVGGDLVKVQSTLALGFAKIGTALAAAAAELIAAAPAVAAMIVVVAALGAAVGVLFLALMVMLAPFAALANLLLTLPGFILALVVVIAPLVLALKDLGKVFELLGEKDPKKFAEGLKALPPVMRQIVGILKPFMARFKQLRDTIQLAFFQPIVKRLGPALDQLLSTLLVGMSAIASALGEVVAQVLKLFTDPAFNGALTGFMLTLADFIRANAGVLTTLINGLMAAAVAALPVVQLLLGKFNEFLVQFATWITGAITDGRFEEWLRIGIAALTVIWGLVKALIGLFVALFARLQTGGREFLAILTNAINKFTAWVKSPEGQHSLENMVKLAKLIAVAFEVALGFVIQMVNKVSALMDMINWVNNHIGNPLGGIGKAIKWAGGFSGGGIVPHDGMAMVHNDEAILDPANSPARNRGILAEAGMLNLLEPQAPQVNVFIGNEQLDARTDYRIARANQRTARTLSTGPRS
jgi:hypothetical protein